MDKGQTHSKGYSSEEHDRKHGRKEVKRKRKKHDRKKRRRKKRNYSSDSSSSDDSYRQRKKHRKKKKPNKEKKKKIESNMSTDNLRRNHAFVDSLHNLFEISPALSTDLPSILIRMAGGTSFDLSKMHDSGTSEGLKRVFESLEVFGVECSNSTWSWRAPGRSISQNNELLLLRIARSLMDELGITMEVIERYGKSIEQEQSSSNGQKKEKLAETESSFNPIQREMLSLLDRFRQRDPSFVQQMASLCSAIIDGESIAIDNLPDENLRQGLESVFRAVGLDYSEMANDDDDGRESTEMGYGLPETNESFAVANMQSILDVCNEKIASTKTSLKRSMKGPLPEHMASAYPSQKESEEESDDDEGPLPVTAAKARKGASMEVVNASSELREEELGCFNRSVAKKPKDEEREEWMINPGEHDLLQGIRSGTMKNRSFENKKVRPTCVTNTPAASVHPSMQAEVNAIIEAHKSARGASLMEQHRMKKKNEKALKDEQNGSNSFNWSREKDLDAGRRVDKDSLRLLMGGAGGGLRDKFQGGFNKL